MADNAPRFRRSQIKDPAFFKANNAAIVAAAKSGRIIDDRGKPVEAKPFFSQTQLRDTKFFREHQREIQQAQREGRIVKDVNRARRVGGAIVEAQLPAASVGEQPLPRAGGADFGSVTGHAAPDNTIRQSQLRDPEFFREHQHEIERAHREGRIIRNVAPF